MIKIDIIKPFHVLYELYKGVSPVNEKSTEEKFFEFLLFINNGKYGIGEKSSIRMLCKDMGHYKNQRNKSKVDEFIKYATDYINDSKNIEIINSHFAYRKKQKTSDIDDGIWYELRLSNASLESKFDNIDIGSALIRIKHGQKLKAEMLRATDRWVGSATKHNNGMTFYDFIRFNADNNRMSQRSFYIMTNVVDRDSSYPYMIGISLGYGESASINKCPIVASRVIWIRRKEIDEAIINLRAWGDSKYLRSDAERKILSKYILYRSIAGETVVPTEKFSDVEDEDELALRGVFYNAVKCLREKNEGDIRNIGERLTVNSSSFGHLLID